MGRAKAEAMPGMGQAGHEGGSLEKANGTQRKRGDAPRACAVEIPAMGAQPVATSTESLLGPCQSQARELGPAVPAASRAVVCRWLGT